MPSNAEIIEMQLWEMLKDTNQMYHVRWADVMAYCIGYYETITMDHLVAITNLERCGYICKGDVRP